MREAVIVSYARTGMAKTGRGSLNDTHGITHGRSRHQRARSSAAALKRLLSKTCSSAPPSLKAPPVTTSLAMPRSGPAARRLRPVPRSTVFCSSGLQAIANASHTIINEGAAVTVRWRRRRASLSCPRSGHMNLHRYTEDELMKKWPAIWMSMIETAEIVADRYGVSREDQESLLLCREPASHRRIPENGYMARKSRR